MKAFILILGLLMVSCGQPRSTEPRTIEPEPYHSRNHQVQFRNFEINYSIFNTTFLAPSIASSYNLKRSKKTALINITVIKINEDGSRSPHTANIKGTEFDLIIKKPLNFSPIKEKNALYYIASVEIQNKIPLYFDIQIQPEKGKPAYNLTFKKLLYVD